MEKDLQPAKPGENMDVEKGKLAELSETEVAQVGGGFGANRSNCAVPVQSGKDGIAGGKSVL
ncbi:hypothetical protein UC34_14150 [Pandoraea vervacti]|uniref:Bacteriocin n=1 Tax=Pandoraea vervacti TaxID=656178 RepID=A0ABM5SZ68_9BURK|nr:hypothetical protein [Pandoraea vervacti]AJP57815.1 hypothetical protein UC34_14150 [Pandoraea vervacti]